MTADPIRQLKNSALGYGLLGLLLVALAIKWRVSVCLYPFILGPLIYFFLLKAFGKMFRAVNLDREQVREFQRMFQQQFSRENLPRQVFWLLLAVAEADGTTDEEERDLVRRFLSERFTDPATAADLREWEATRIRSDQVGALALGLGRVLSGSERETVFFWCCLVAFADGSYQPEEHIVLQQIARSFGLEGHHARRIFHQARQAHLTGEEPGHQQRQYSQGYGGGGGHTKARGTVSSRGEALAILGLAEGASESAIKRRHRELVLNFHPDKHQHLGDVAAGEAEERFRQVQAAYEVLAG